MIDIIEVIRLLGKSWRILVLRELSVTLPSPNIAELEITDDQEGGNFTSV
jgi:DNA-binding HxlR family transcriptional regulator